MLEETFQRLIKIIEKTDITWKWIEKETGISSRTIRRWIKGTHKPHPVLYLELKKIVDRLYLILNKSVKDEIAIQEYTE